ncbi:MAG: hypothetical protein ABI768_05230 [Acidobacteriota bacterium]
MRLTAKGSLTGALLLLPFALALGCTCTPGTSSSPPPPANADKSVTITLVPQNGTSMPTPDSARVSLSRKANHRALWVYCGDGDLEISMKDAGDDPFDADRQRWSAKGCQYIRSGNIKPKARTKQDADEAGRPYKPYEYTIQVKVGNNVYINDPEIEIDR